jgi:hypothetical protein
VRPCHGRVMTAEAANSVADRSTGRSTRARRSARRAAAAAIGTCTSRDRRAWWSIPTSARSGTSDRHDTVAAGGALSASYAA